MRNARLDEAQAGIKIAGTISKVKRQPSEWEKIIVNETEDVFWNSLVFFFF